MRPSVFTNLQCDSPSVGALLAHHVQRFGAQFTPIQLSFSRHWILDWWIQFPLDVSLLVFVASRLNCRCSARNAAVENEAERDLQQRGYLAVSPKHPKALAGSMLQNTLWRRLKMNWRRDKMWRNIAQYTSQLIAWYSCFSEPDMDTRTILILVSHAGPMYWKFWPSQDQIGIYLEYRVGIGSNILCDMAPYQFDLQ